MSGDQLVAALLGLAPQEVGRVGDLGRLVEDEERPGGHVVQTGRGAQDGGPDLGRVAGLERAGGRGDVVGVARMRAQLPGAGADALLEAGQVRGQTLRQPGREASGQPGEPLPDLGDAVGGYQELTGGEQRHFLDGADAALVGRIEGSHRVDLVAEQLDPDRQRGRGREDVHESTSAGELAAAGDLENRVVAESEQLAEQLILVEPGTHAQAARFGRDLGRVERVLEQRLDAGYQDAGPARTPLGQRRHASRGFVADQLAALVGQGRARLQNRHAVGIAEPRLQLLGHAIADLGVAGDPAQPLAGAAGPAVEGERRGQECLGAVRHSRERRVPPAPGEWRALRPEPLPQRREGPARVQKWRQDVQVRQPPGVRGSPGSRNRRGGFAARL